METPNLSLMMPTDSSGVVINIPQWRKVALSAGENTILLRLCPKIYNSLDKSLFILNYVLICDFR